MRAFTFSSTLPLSAPETGQLSFASSAASANASCETPGTKPVTSIA